MNKVITSAIVGLALGACSAVSALDMSVGGGLNLSVDAVPQGVDDDWSYGSTNYKMSLGFANVSYGVNAFFDLQYALVDLAFGYGGGRLQTKYFIDGNERPYGTNWNATSTIMALGISVLGKYNIPVPGQEETMEFFPALGVEYQLALSAEIDNNYFDYVEAGDFSQILIRVGGGYDYKINDKLFGRVLALYGFGLPSKFSKDFAKQQFVQNINTGFTAAFVSNVTVKLDIGYKL